jgi:aryl-alcohol dehydrogenase-like predicted oxidoreductase
MEYRALGATGIATSVIGFGCGGNARLMVGDDEELRVATVRRALAAGVNYFDTAAAYGEGRSEINLGRDLRTLGTDALISTKIVLQSAHRNDPRSAVLGLVEGSLARLDRTHVDILFLHNRVFEQSDGSDHGIGAKLCLDDVFSSKGIAAAFDELIAGGVTKVVGFTAYGGDVSAITALIDSRLFGALNVSLNLLNPSAALRAPSSFSEPDYAEVVTRAQSAGMGVLAMQVFARGVLAGAGPQGGREAAVARTARMYDDSLASTALRYVLGKPGVTSAILGLSAPGHVDEALAALAKGTLSPEAEQALDGAAFEP